MFNRRILTRLPFFFSFLLYYCTVLYPYSLSDSVSSDFQRKFLVNAVKAFRIIDLS